MDIEQKGIYMYTNNSGIPLSAAVWLAHDDYDHNDDPNHISATSLLKSVRQIVLGSRAAAKPSAADIHGLIASRIGTALHSTIENVWLDNHKECLTKLGYPKGLIDKVRINPTTAELQEWYDDDIEIVPIYMERRSSKEIEGMNVSGKFDFVMDGRLEDFKSTGTYTYVNRTNDKKYQLQGSIYRWLNQGIITKDHMAIIFIFLDWKPGLANDPKYPPNKVMEHKIPLLSVAQTEQYVSDKLIAVKQYIDADESTLPACNAEDLWQKDSVFKYYKNPAKMTRSTKNFTNMHDANIRMGQDGNIGTVVEVKGEPTGCKYCDGFDLCSQKNAYILNNSLKL